MRLASERLHVSQPAISRQIQDLESELGLLLFERSQRGLKLTPAGQTYYVEAVGILHALDLAGRRAKQVALGASGHLRIGYVENAGWGGPLTHALHRLQTELPDVVLELRTANTPEQLAAIEAGNLDGGFVYLYGSLSEHIDTLPLLDHDVVLALPRAWREAENMMEPVDLHALRDLPFILFPRKVYPDYYDRLLGAWRELGFKPNIAYEAGTESAILSMVSAGLGAAVVNSANLDRPPAQVRFLKLQSLSIPMPLTFAYRRNSCNPVLQRFISIVHQVMEAQR